MNEFINRSLFNLLTANSALPYADDCAREIENGNLVEESAGPVAIREVIDMYGPRALWVKKRGLPIYGIDEVVANLEKTDRTLIDIQTVDADDHRYIIFSDEKREILFGIIAIERSANWRELWKRPFYEPREKRDE